MAEAIAAAPTKSDSFNEKEHQQLTAALEAASKKHPDDLGIAICQALRHWRAAIRPQSRRQSHGSTSWLRTRPSKSWNQAREPTRVSVPWPRGRSRSGWSPAPALFKKTKSSKSSHYLSASVPSKRPGADRQHFLPGHDAGTRRAGAGPRGQERRGRGMGQNARDRRHARPRQKQETSGRATKCAKGYDQGLDCGTATRRDDPNSLPARLCVSPLFKLKLLPNRLAANAKSGPAPKGLRGAAATGQRTIQLADLDPRPLRASHADRAAGRRA